MWLGIALGVLGLDYVWGFGVVKKVGSKIFQPVRGGLYELKVDKAAEERVMDQVEELSLEAEVVKLKTENDRLRELLETPLDPAWQFIPAKVLKFSGNELRVDAGQKEGVKVGQTVMVLARKELNNGVIVGRVKQVGIYESEVSLLSSLEIKVKMANGVEGLVKLGDGEMRVTEVLQSQQLREGDLVMSLGGDGWLPELVVGTVGEVYQEDEAVFKEAKINLGIDVSQVIEVWVVGS